MKYGWYLQRNLIQKYFKMCHRLSNDVNNVGDNMCDS